METELNKNLSQKQAIEIIDDLIAYVNNALRLDHINYGFFEKWFSILEGKTKLIFKNYNDILILLKYHQAERPLLELNKIYAADKIVGERKRIDENNKKIFAYQVGKLLELKKDISEKNGVNEKKIVILDFPENTNWEDLTLKFINKYEIEIFLKDKFLKKVNNEDIGFYDGKSKDKNPDKQWGFLLQLSCDNGEYDLSNKTNIKENEKCRQYKSKLSKKLIKAFNIADEPFFEYDEKKRYKTKFKLMSTPELRGSGEIRGFNEVKKEYLGNYNN